ncbi:MAG: glycoside hydrolase family 95 protein [Lentimicrobiaceae bacterium]|nr:glycoside hydrolase family 95 protein [Lentimicrobiaceae bacterium]
MKKNIILCIWCLFMVSCSDSPLKKKYVLWFSEPGTKWEEAIPIGNGRLGAMVQGGTKQDIWSLNEETLWSGYPQDKQNYDAIKYLPEIRSLLNKRKTKEAEKLIDAHMLGPWNECYQPVGDLILDFDHPQKISGYRRELNMDNGLVEITYQAGDVTYTREIFSSYPDNTLVARIKASRKGALNFSVSLNSQLPCKVSASGNDLTLEGRAPSHAYPHYLNSSLKNEFELGKGMRFQVLSRILPSGGQITYGKGSMTVKGADEVVIMLAIQTSYNGFDKDPYTEGKDYKVHCSDDIDKAVKKGFDQLKNAHVKDYVNLFGRMDIDLGTDSATIQPMQERIKNYQAGKDPNLAALYFQFGRYLLISSSRPGTKAATLQGIWNKDVRPAWSSNYTLNCNVELNYWPVNLTNLAECHLPLIDLVKDLSVDGARTAKNIYGARGWMAHHNADLWRTTSPVGGTGLWSIYQVGGAWLTQHLWEQYLFTLDKAYLADVWPTMKGAALYFVDALQKDPKTGWLVTNPSESFENQYVRPDGVVGWACVGSTQDMQIIRSLFNYCIEASKILGIDKEFADQLSTMLPQLPPMLIDPVTGQIQEWLDPWQAVNPLNGQVAQGWGLAPGHLISLRKTPELAEAFRKTIEFRKPGESSNSGSWTGAFSANFQARLEDGANLQKVIDRHFKLALFPNFASKFFEKYWEIDGNLGITAAIGEMMLQSHNCEVHLLPALSPAYPTGSVRGLCARGNFEVNIVWENGVLINAEILSKSGGHCTVRYKEKTIEILTERGKTYHFITKSNLLNADKRIILMNG